MKRILRYIGIPLTLLFLIGPAYGEPLPSLPTAEAEPFAGGHLSAFADEKKTETDYQERYPALLAGDSGKAGNSEPLPRDLLFVIDNSGSMKKNDPAFITKRFITEFLDQLEPGDRCGMILFDSRARLVTPLTEMDQANRFLTLEKNLSQVNYKGQFTNSPAGIERAINELNVSGRREATKSIVFLTDGIVDTGSKSEDREKTKWLKEDLTDQCRHSGIRIFGIAFTEKADFNLIQSLAVKTNGAYFRAQDATDVGAVFDSVLEHLEPAPLLEESVAEQTRPTLATEALEPQLAATSPPAPALQEKAATMADTAQSIPVEQSGSVTPGLSLRPANKPTVEHPTPVQLTAPFGWSRVYQVLMLTAFLAISVMTLYISKQRGPGRPRNDQLPGLPVARAEIDHIIKVPVAQLISQEEACSDCAGLPLMDKRQTTIGRSQLNDIVLDQAAVSAFHASISYQGGCFKLEDLRSTNGTFVNGQRIGENTAKRLKNGDSIIFANTEFRFLHQDHNQTEQTMVLPISALAEPTTGGPTGKLSAKEQLAQHFKTVLSQQLYQVVGLGKPYAQFVQQYLPPDTLTLLEAKVVNKCDDGEGKPLYGLDMLYRPPITYALCPVPVTPEKAAAWFQDKHDGFLRFLRKVVYQEVEQQPGCDILCLVSYGWVETPWVSLTVIATGEGEHPMEIVSVEFLTKQELEKLSLQFDAQGRPL